MLLRLLRLMVMCMAGLASSFEVTAIGAVAEAPGVIEVVPPPQYRTWWAQAQRCTGRTRSMGEVRFAVVQGETFVVGSDERLELLGFFNPFTNTAYVAQGQMFNPLTVKHEMVHALGVFGHPEAVFRKCGLR